MRSWATDRINRTAVTNGAGYVSSLDFDHPTPDRLPTATLAGPPPSPPRSGMLVDLGIFAVMGRKVGAELGGLLDPGSVATEPGVRADSYPRRGALGAGPVRQLSPRGRKEQSSVRSHSLRSSASRRRC
jgi:hypothetical protein